MKKAPLLLILVIGATLVASDSWGRSGIRGPGSSSYTGHGIGRRPLTPTGRRTWGNNRTGFYNKQITPLSDKYSRDWRLQGKDKVFSDPFYKYRRGDSFLEKPKIKQDLHGRGSASHWRRRRGYRHHYFSPSLFNFYYCSPYYGHVGSSGFYFYYRHSGRHHSISLSFGSPGCTFGYGCCCPFCTRVTHYCTYIVNSGFDVDYATMARRSYSYGFGGLSDDEKEFWKDYREKENLEGENADLFNLRFGEESQRLIAALRLGESSSEKAVKLLKGSALNDESEIVRIQAIMSLGKIGDASAAPTLKYIAKNDKSETVRAAAVRALKKIDPEVEISESD